MKANSDCIFCHYDDKELMGENSLAVAFLDKFPAGEGHTLIVPRRHIEDIVDATDEEALAIFHLLKEVRRKLTDQYGVEDFTMFINRGEKGGQTIPHMHLHCLPRK